MIWSKYQQDIFEVVEKTDKNIIISSTAGSGKTSTIIECSKRIDPKKSILFLAFNKSIVEELKTKLPNNVKCSTMHSLGMRALIYYYKIQLKVSDFKTLGFADAYINEFKKELNTKEKWSFKFAVSDLINLARMNLSDFSVESLCDLSDKHGLELSNQEINETIHIYKNIEEYNKYFMKDKNTIDFTDMVYLPAYNDSIKFEQYDYIAIDELQDLNKCQKKLVEKLIKPSGRLIGVGDPRQCIYSFAGSDIESFDNFKNRKNTITLPLSISYRCAKKIVENAQNVYDEIQPYENAKDGIIRRGSIDEANETDIIISRNTRPLISAYFQLLAQGKKAKVIGKDIERGLIKIIAKIRMKSKTEGLEHLRKELMKLKDELVLKGVSKPENNFKYQAFLEKIKVIEIVGKECEYMFQIEKKIEDIFADSTEAIKLMTIHKSKGLEAERIFYIEKYEGKLLCPSVYAQQLWEKTQERNLLFVAYTRAKSELVYVDLN